MTPPLVVVGNLTWDRLIEVPSFPERNRDYLTLSDSAHAGGAGGNVAAGLTLLGVPTAMAAAVGFDQLGADLVEELGSYGVDTSLIQKVEATTSEFLCIIDPSGDRSFLLNPEQAAFSHGSVGPHTDEPAGYAFVGCRLALAEQILSAANQPRSRCFANIGFWIASGELTPERGEVLDQLNCLFLNDDEFDSLPEPLREKITGSDFLDENRHVVITGGAAEAVALTSQGSIALAPSPHPAIVNTLGCGDAFMAGYLAAHLRGSEVERCLSLAHECAARVASSPRERDPRQFDQIGLA
jgi:acarbose 7IV-phosphotransferase